jgi:5'-deoxynucleotidase YfbR-like HD superfamily hydrolase
MGEVTAISRAWQRMLSGRRLDILSPSPLDIEIEDIALGLSRIARWNGQTIGEHGYSVAQHSILVAELVAYDSPKLPAKGVLAALLHDAPEYVTADLVTPFKSAVGDAYRALEERVAKAVHLAFKLPPTLPSPWADAINAADKLAACIEATRLAGFSESEAKQITGVRRQLPSISLEPWASKDARCHFIKVYDDLASGGEKCLQKWRGKQLSCKVNDA